MAKKKPEKYFILLIENSASFLYKCRSDHKEKPKTSYNMRKIYKHKQINTSSY